MDFDVSRLPELPFMALFDIAGSGNVRYFWLYIVTGLIIGYLAHRASGDKRAFGAVLFARDAWLSRSALNDYGIVVINPVIRFLCITWLITNLHAIVATGGSLIRSAGVSGSVNDGAALALGGLLTLVIFIVSDFLRFALHYLEHRLPVLWEFHKVHHSAEVLNFATADRIHPMELLFTGCGMAIGMGLVNGAFIAAWGDQLTIATVAGANIFYVFFNIIGGVLRHSPVWVSFGPRIERWIVSPAMHHIHHSADPRHFDSNFGGSLAIWDRMFGTIHIPKGREVEAFGLGPETAEYRSLSALYGLPFIKAWRILKGGADTVASPGIDPAE